MGRRRTATFIALEIFTTDARVWKDLEDEIAAAFRHAARETINFAHKRLRIPTRGWTRQNKPVFKKPRKNVGRPGEYAREVTTNSAPYVYLALGTTHRWALMAPGWVSKTIPNQLASRPVPKKKHRVLIRGAGAMLRAGIPARPGIEARNWQEIVARESEPFLEQVVVQDLSLAFARHEIKYGLGLRGTAFISGRNNLYISSSRYIYAI